MVEIADKYAKAGQFSQALMIAKAIGDANEKASALAEIAGQYAEANMQPSEEDKAILREITHTTSPISQFWK